VPRFEIVPTVGGEHRAIYSYLFLLTFPENKLRK
jgi:hypothetical protein